MVRSLYEITECPQCASQNIIHNAKSMQLICKDCGLIHDPLKPLRNVGLLVATSMSNKESIIRPAQKATVRKPAKRPEAAKPSKPKPTKPKRKKPKKPITKKKPTKSIGAKVKVFVKKFIKRR